MSHSLRLLERLAACISLAEPILLVGETGTGKTTVVQHLATLMPNRPTLHVVNMSQQSDSSDLLGGFRPVDARFLVKPLKTEFDLLFKRTFSVKKNAAFIESVNRVYIKGNWKMLCSAFSNGLKMAEKVFEKRREQQLSSSSSNESLDQDASPPPPSSPSCRDAEEQAAPLSKRIKVHDAGLEEEWFQFKQQLDQLGAQLDSIDNKFLFSFVEGTLVKAVRNGDWVLLDEINLANPETLECLSGLLQGIDGSLLLMERGDTEPIQRHPDFRLLCCMNPANDAGKRDLPPGLRSRFSEFWVDSPDRDVNDLLVLIQRYIKDHLPPALEGQATVAAVAEFYQTAKQLALHDLVDGAGHRVHFSIRTLSRMLSYAVSIAPTYGLRRALYEGAVMTFLTQLNKDGQAKLSKVIETTVLKGIRNTAAFVRQTPKPPATNSASSTTSDLLDATKKMSLTDTHVLFHSFWLQRGSLELFDEEALSKYVLTPSVQGNLANLARAVMSHRYPVLIQGPTSAGKTSMIEYLAKRTGHRFVRINNHEHTDLQEYVGSYVTDDFGKLVFKEVKRGN